MTTAYWPGNPKGPLVQTIPEADEWGYCGCTYQLVLRKKGWRVQVDASGWPEPVYMTIDKFRQNHPNAPYLKKQRPWRDTPEAKPNV